MAVTTLRIDPIAQGRDRLRATLTRPAGTLQQAMVYSGLHLPAFREDLRDPPRPGSGLFRLCEARVKTQTADLRASGFLERTGICSYRGPDISK
jgi:hypothetical protein